VDCSQSEDNYGRNNAIGSTTAFATGASSQSGQAAGGNQPANQSKQQQLPANQRKKQLEPANQSKQQPANQRKNQQDPANQGKQQTEPANQGKVQQELTNQGNLGQALPSPGIQDPGLLKDSQASFNKLPAAAQDKLPTVSLDKNKQLSTPGLDKFKSLPGAAPHKSQDPGHSSALPAAGQPAGRQDSSSYLSAVSQKNQLPADGKSIFW